MMQITEDTPPDMLAGAMDLMVHLPDGKITKMAVERSTPMMDVLVQITNSNRLQISGYVLQPLAIKNSPSASERVLPYFPNTPIGALDTQDIRVVPKRSGGSSTLQRGGVPQQPFESTFRLKVHLPRNQLYVERVSMNAYLGDIMKKMCDEKNLDSNKYEFRHPGNLDETLDLQLRLADYQITEVHAVNKGTRPISQVFSSSDSIMAFRKEDERKQKSHGGGGIFNFLKRGKVSNGSGSLSSDNRSISPTHSDDSRSVSPPVSNGKMPLEKPKPPARKRRPAPKPPSIVPEDKKTVEDGTTTNVTMRKKDGITICHSRNSSDSSGYHEASILSDNANTSLPRKRPQTIVDGTGSKTSGNLTMMKAQSKSTSSLAFPNRNKKKAPAPPPGLKSAGSVARLETASPVVASPIEDDAQQSATDGGNNIKRNEESTFAPQHSPPESIASSLATTLSSNIETDIGTNIREIEEEEYEDNKIIENTNNCYNEVPTKSNEVPTKSNEPTIDIIKPEVTKPEEEKRENITESPKIETLVKEENVKKTPEEHQEPKEIETKIPDPLILPVTKPAEEKNIPISPLETTDWEYRLPSPPTAFRDDTSPPNEVIKQESSESVSDILPPSTDSILTSPELFEKLNAVKEAQTEVRSIQSIESEAVTVNESEEKFISKLSLENLERRKQLVYNRELATSLKCPEQTEEAKEIQKRNSVLGELEEVLAKPQSDAPNTDGGKNWNRVKSAVENFSSRRDRTLPNFKITTYDIPKKNINIYEDDSVRSKVPNNTEEYNIQRVVRPSRQEFYKHRCMTLNRDLQRSESFNTWTPNAPVQRSKSQVAIKPDIQKNKEKDNTLIGEESRSRSTLDLTGLQSLEVMKAIRTTLTTTETTSTVTKSSKSIDEVDTTHKLNQEIKQITKEPSRRPVSMYTMPTVNLTSWKERKPQDNPTIPPKPTNGSTFTNLNGTHPENNEVKKTPTTNTKSSNETVKVSNENPKTNANQNNVNVSIKVNGTEAISQQAGGNVVIRIKPEQQKDESTQRFINHTTAIGYRKPLGNVNKVVTRPHSFAFDPFRYDASRVPIVRSVELKKPFKEAGSNNTSVTQIRHEGVYLNGNNDTKVNNNVNKVNLFENVVLRKVASNKREQRPQTVNLTDQRGQLLESIRNFGGKKGLKTVND